MSDKNLIKWNYSGKNFRPDLSLQKYDNNDYYFCYYNNEKTLKQNYIKLKLYPDGTYRNDNIEETVNYFITFSNQRVKKIMNFLISKKQLILVVKPLEIFENNLLKASCNFYSIGSTYVFTSYMTNISFYEWLDGISDTLPYFNSALKISRFIEYHFRRRKRLELIKKNFACMLDIICKKRKDVDRKSLPTREVFNPITNISRNISSYIDEDYYSLFKNWKISLDSNRYSELW
tara:strand:+ start:428 stop:1126 length:699 start_codon:yes stop_codon:yes gene_type:complete